MKDLLVLLKHAKRIQRNNKNKTTLFDSIQQKI